MAKSIDEMRRELDALNRRNVRQPEPVKQDERQLDPPVTDQERIEHEQYITEGGTLRLADWTFVQREFRKVFGPDWPNLR